MQISGSTIVNKVGKRVSDYNGVTYQSRITYSCGAFLTNTFIALVNGDAVLTHTFIALSTLRDVPMVIPVDYRLVMNTRYSRIWKRTVIYF